MEQTYSLVSILRDDPDLGTKFTKSVQETREIKKSLVQNAEDFNKKYKQEIDDGTKRRQLLLAEGQSKGLIEAEIDWGGKFLPTRQTPILNFLYFLLRDHGDEDSEQLEQLRQRYEAELGHLQHDEDITDQIDPELLYLLLRATGKTNDEVRAIQNTQTGHLQEEYEMSEAESVAEEPVEMDTAMFSTIGHELFKKIKKLKRLSKSPNEHESSAAYKKCRELCDEYHVDFNRIPD